MIVSAPKNADVIVLGAGIVGVSSALHLQKRGRSVILVDRRGVAEETSYGNTGIIQREGVVPYPFPRDLRLIAALRLQPAARGEPALERAAQDRAVAVRYWRASTPERKAATARGARPLIERCIVEHEALLADAGRLALLRRTGYLRLYRSAQALDAAIAQGQADREAYGVNFQPVMRRRRRRAGAASDGSHRRRHPDARSGQRGRSGRRRQGLRAAVRGARRAHRARRGAARCNERRRAAGRCDTPEGRCRRRPWWSRSGRGPTTCCGRWAIAFPLGVKRGYHMHFRPQGNATLNRPVLDAQYGYALAPMTRGHPPYHGRRVRRARCAADAGAARSRRAAARARSFRSASASMPSPGSGAALPARHAADDRPGTAPQGLWLNFGHHHLGFTLGPVTGRLLAEMMTGEAAVHRSRALPRRSGSADPHHERCRSRCRIGRTDGGPQAAAVPGAAAAEAGLDQALAMDLPAE